MGRGNEQKGGNVLSRVEEKRAEMGRGAEQKRGLD